MNRRERLMATLNGKPVDRPAVNFYEINGAEDMASRDPFNIYSDPSWKPLIELARDKTDRIVMMDVRFKDERPDSAAGLYKTDSRLENGSRFSTTTVQAGRRTLTARSRQDPDVNTVWMLEHLVKDVDDFCAWLDLPEVEFSGEPDTSSVLQMEQKLGDSGIVMLGVADPLCHVAPLFDMGEFTVMAMTEPELFHRGLEKMARTLYRRTEAIAKALPGRLWRVVGAEYASPPYLRPDLFKDYVTRYDTQIVQTIQKYGGFARVHSHGRLHDILDHIVATGCMGLDPIEPPSQGDVELAYVREKYGKELVLFGNLEISDIENLPAERFREKVTRALHEGTSGQGRGFVLMPSACPYGRKLSPVSMKNYEIMVDLIERL